MLALAATMQSDPLAAAAMMQNMQQMMVPMASAPGVNQHQLAQAQGGLYLLQQMMAAANASAAAAAAKSHSPPIAASVLHENASAKPDSGIPESGANAAKPEKRGT